MHSSPPSHAAFAALLILLLAASGAVAQNGTAGGPGGGDADTDGPIDVYTDRIDHLPGEVARIHLANAGSTTLHGTPDVRVQDADGRVVFSPARAQVIEELPRGFRYTLNWSQTDNDGKRVPAGDYVVRGSFAGHTDAQAITIGAPPAGAPRLRAVPERSSVPPGEPVPILVKNDGTGAFDGTIRFLVYAVRPCASGPCPLPNLVWEEAPVEAHIDGGSAHTWVWRGQTTSGRPAESGLYEVRADAVQAGAGGTASIALVRIESSRTTAVWWVSPASGESVADDVRVAFLARDMDTIPTARVVLLRGNGQDERKVVASWTFGALQREVSIEHVIPAAEFGGVGERCVVLEITDGGGVVEAVERCFTISRATGIGVATDRSSYGQGEVVEIRVKNVGSTPLVGRAAFNVSDPLRGLFVFRAPSANVSLPPGESHVFRWDQRDADGRLVPPGTYTINAGLDDTVVRRHFHADARVAIQAASTAAFDLRVVSPLPGAGVRGPLSVTLLVGPPGATSLRVDVVGPGTAAAERSFLTPLAGEVKLAFDLAALPAGEYRLLATATGPGGKASAVASFAVLPLSSADARAPVLTVVHPVEGRPAPPSFPVAFEVEDDLGVVYAEAYLRTDDGEDRLVARESWPAPVQRGTFVFDAGEVRGERLLVVKVYDLGEHADKLAMNITISSDAPDPCVPTGVDRVVAWWCRGPLGAPTPAVPPQAGASYRADELRVNVTPSGAVTDVSLGGKVFLERVNATIGPTAPTRDRDGRLVLEGESARIVAGEKRVVVTSTTGDLVTIDLPSDFTLTRRDRNIMLEAPDGTSVLIVVTNGEVRILGTRLLAILANGGSLVARPVDAGSPLDPALSDAFVRGNVGAEITVTSLGADTQPYAPLDVDVSVAGAGDAQKITARLSTEEHAGRLLVFTLGEGIGLGTDVEVLLDGVLLSKASSLEDVVDPTDDAGESEYYVVVDGDVAKVLVSVGHFSERTLVIQMAGLALPPFVTMPAILIAVLVIVAGTAGLLRRTKGP